MSYRTRLARLEKAIPLDLPRCRCGAHIGGAPPIRVVFEDKPGPPECCLCGCPLRSDGRAVRTVPPGSHVKVMVL